MKRFAFWRRRPNEGTATGVLVLPDQSPFMAAKDAREVQRLNEQHFTIRTELGGNHAAPLVAPGAILDVGCGTGRWAMEVAVEFPQARVVGLDIIMPDPVSSLGLGIDTLPPNATFMQADATQPLPFPDASFDYAHLCMLYAVLPATAWAGLIRELLRVVRPGGWVESVEAVPFANAQGHSGMAAITFWFSDLLRQRGADPLVALKLAGWLRVAGLAEVVQREISIDDGTEDQDEAILAASALIDYLREPVIATGIATREQFEAAAAQGLAEVHYTTRGSGFKTYVTYGRRLAHS